MNNLSKMASTQSLKAFVATLIAMIGTATASAENGFTLTEILTIIGVGIAAFQATYWTTNASTGPSTDSGQPTLPTL
jgi:hypothetical protein